MVTGFAVNHIRQRGPEIRIRFPDAENLAVNKTEIKHLGVTVGKMTGVEISTITEKPSVIVIARLDRASASLAREGTKFVIVKPEVSISGVQGLSTIFRGATVSLIPGEGPSAPEGTVFQGYPDGRSLNRDRPGLEVRLITPRSGGLENGAGVNYRGLRVGSVVDTTLSPTSQNVVLTIKIEQKFADLIRTNTVFWDTSGIRAKIGLFGAKIDVDSLQTLMAGGVSLATPDAPGPRALPNAQFPLQEASRPEWDKWSPKI